MRILFLITLLFSFPAFAQWGYEDRQDDNSYQQEQRAYEQQLEQRREAEEAARREQQQRDYNDSVRDGGDLLYGDRSGRRLMERNSNSYGGF